MRIAVFGATGRVGAEVVRQALEDGVEVRAFARGGSADRLPEGVTVETGELTDDDAVARCVAGVDAVISALGPRSNTPDQPSIFGDALARITARMADAEVRRLVAVSGAATVLEGERPDLGRRMVRSIMKLVAGHVLETKQREAAVITAHPDLEWVLVRPPRIVDGPPTGRAEASLDRPRGMKVSAGDVAAFMLRCAREDDYVRRAPFIAS